MKTLELIPGAGPTRKHIRLITAAPEMLEALQLLLASDSDGWEKAAAAVKKATEPSYERT